MKKMYLLVSIFLLSVLYSSAQQRWEFDKIKDDVKNYPYWIDLKSDKDANFYDVQYAFEQYWQDRKITKGCGWKQFKRWEYNMLSHIKPDGSYREPMHVWNEYYKFKDKGLKSLGDWSELGPKTMKTRGQLHGLGRLNGIAFHPTDPNTFWVAAPSGGLWKTVNNGETWTSNTDNLPTLGVSSILLDHNNLQIMYIGTGDRDAGDAIGLGVMKSTDGGATWVFAKNGMGDATVGMMVMHPTNPNIIWAATSNGIFKTTDGAANWTQTAIGSYTDIEIKPDDASVLYTTSDGTFYYSIDNGETWTRGTGVTGQIRLAIAVSPAQPNYVYAIASDGETTDGYFGGLYKSTNAGQSFVLVTDKPNLLGWEYDGSDAGGQGWYDLAIAVDPANANNVYTGGVNAWKSSNGGSAWECVGLWYDNIHADHHDLAFAPDGRLFSMNDGGIYYTTDGGQNWIDISSGLAITQIYRMGHSTTNMDLVVNGYQDNGSAIYKGYDDFVAVYGGDGMECAIDPTDDNYIYVELYYGSIARSSSGVSGQFQSIAGNGTNGITEDGAWVTPYILNPSDPNTMFIGYANVWRSVNVKTPTSSNVTWKKISAFTGSATINDICLSEADNTTLYVSRGYYGELYRSDNSDATTPTWTDLSSNLLEASSPNTIVTHPTNTNIVYIGSYGKVYKSSNKGQDWIDISGSLPNVNINDLVFDKTSTETLYAATQIGIYMYDGTAWIEYNKGLPVIDVRELEIFYNQSNNAFSKLRAATYGRGMWESPLNTSSENPPVAEFSASQTVGCVDNTIIFTDKSAANPTEWLWTISPNTVIFVNGTNATSQNPEIQFQQSGKYTVTLTATNDYGNDTEIKTDYIEIGGHGLSFNEGFENGFETNGWTIKNPDGGITWQIVNVEGNGSTKAAAMDFYNYESAGAKDQLISPPLDFSNQLNVSLSFQYAYTIYSLSYIDKLRVYISDDCGSTWDLVFEGYEDGIGSFVTRPYYEEMFVPSTSDDWCISGDYGNDCITIDLSKYAGSTGVKIMFESENAYSNNLYIDNIIVTGNNVENRAPVFITTPIEEVIINK